MSSLVRDSSYHDMYFKGCGLLCAHKKSFNTAIPVRSPGPYMYIHYCTCIVHILVWTYLFLLTSFFDCLSFCGLFLKHPYKRFFPFYILYFYLSRSLSLSILLSLLSSVFLSPSLSSPLSLSLSLSLCLPLSLSPLSILLSLLSSVFLSLSISVYLSVYSSSLLSHYNSIRWSVYSNKTRRFLMSLLILNLRWGKQHNILYNLQCPLYNVYCILYSV